MGDPLVRIGVVGSGFVARHFVSSLERQDGYEVSKVLTRRALESVARFPQPESLCNTLDELLTESDVVVECSGDPIHATDVVNASVNAGLPVVTMNTEFHITAGSYFVGKGIVTEAEGDQPGCLAALHEDAVAMGFEPLVYGNMKGFLNEDPTPDEMAYWAGKQGISLPMVTSFTDGTKVQAEQALVANYFGATIGRPGLIGPAEDDLQVAADLLAGRAQEIGRPISDYVLSTDLPHGVFIVATHDQSQKDALRYYKLGEGPTYVLMKHNIFVHLEILKTVKRVLSEDGVLLDNGISPEISVAAVAKRDLQPGHRIEQGIGSFDARGRAVRIEENIGHLPIGLLQSAVMRKKVRRGDLISFDDVEIPESLAAKAWVDTEQKLN